jgi:hypothetical protein
MPIRSSEVAREAVSVSACDMKASNILRQGLQNLCVLFGRGKDEIGWALEEATLLKSVTPGGVALIRH